MPGTTAAAKAAVGYTYTKINGKATKGEHVVASFITCEGWARDLNVNEGHVAQILTSIIPIAAAILLDATISYVASLVSNAAIPIASIGARSCGITSDIATVAVYPVPVVRTRKRHSCPKLALVGGEMQIEGEQTVVCVLRLAKKEESLAAIPDDARKANRADIRRMRD